ncbi:MAG: dihydrofolate reductase [Bacilli bacterium]|nr:dihydrofolate reductase [Bacilli bacterium]
MLSLIVAIGVNGLIGKNNDLPWHYPEDLKYFKRVTLNHNVFMGYNTYLSIYNRLGKALPNRNNYVLTYESSLPGGGIVVKDINQILELSKSEDVFVIGGMMVYNMMLPYVDSLYITRIKKEYEGNVFFPKYDESMFELVSADDHGEICFEVYKRK